MKRKTTAEYIALTILSLTIVGILYRQLVDAPALPVYAATLPQNKTNDVPITAPERQLIYDYVKSRPGGKPGRALPAGLARKAVGRDRLPVDWEKKLVKGEILPPEIYRECQPLPKELAVRLPTPPLGTVLVALDGRVLRVARTSFEILDIFDARSQ